MTKSSEFYDFPKTSAKAWKQQIQYGLKGEDYNENLVWDSPDLIKVKPFYSSEDLSEKPLRQIPAPQDWSIGQFIIVGDESTANKRAKDSLERGAESLFFELNSPKIELAELISEIDLARVPVHLDLKFLSSDFLSELTDYNWTGNSQVFIHQDVIGNLARSGNWHLSMTEDLEAFLQLVSKESRLNTVSVDGGLYQNAGANRVQQLAYTLAHAREYLHLYSSHQAGNQFPAPTFRLSVDSDYFFEIAKIRAMRLLWASLASRYKAKEQCHIVVQPSRRNKTIYEYNGNLLRTTTECMAAINGGADTVCNLPYDALYHKDNEFGDRIARNQLLILKKESYFGVVSNPADGAYYIESLTEQLAGKALALFKQIEASGGFLQALKEHTIQRKIKESAALEQQLFDQGQKVLVGSNAYENLQDSIKDSIEISPFLKSRPGKTLIEPVLEKRLAEPTEKKRLEDE